MPKFTFIGEHTDLYGNPDGTKVTYEFEVDGLENVLEHADLFIRGCGYNPSGTLDYIPDEEYYGTGPEWQTPEWETPQWETPQQDFSDHGGGSVMADYPELYDKMDLPNVGAGSDVKFGGAGNIHSQYYFDTERNK